MPRPAEGVQQEADVLGDDVAADRSCLLGAAEQQLQRLGHLADELLQPRPRRRARSRSPRRGSGPRRTSRPPHAMNSPIAAPGSSDLGRRRRAGDDRLELTLEDRGDEVVLRREAPEDRRRADPGPLGDVGDARLEAVLGEDDARRLEDPLEVALRVRAEVGRPRRPSGRDQPTTSSAPRSPRRGGAGSARRSRPLPERASARRRRGTRAGSRRRAPPRGVASVRRRSSGSPRSTRGSRARARRRPAARC